MKLIVLFLPLLTGGIAASMVWGVTGGLAGSGFFGFLVRFIGGVLALVAFVAAAAPWFMLF